MIGTAELGILIVLAVPALILICAVTAARHSRDTARTGADLARQTAAMRATIDQLTAAQAAAPAHAQPATPDEAPAAPARRAL